jgi:hypothetical protein
MTVVEGLTLLGILILLGAYLVLAMRFAEGPPR